MKSHKDLQYIQYIKDRLFWLNWGWEAQGPIYLVSPLLPATAPEVLSQKQGSMEHRLKIPELKDFFRPTEL